ncbi:MAG: selenocysteine-specific translation elongation factor [Solirubrobacterales bacterium]|nr:selenocysteine-specific translation elongation factor [Solirubrobacterales bacterium]MBV9716263.1 selenocysteine-specific translation elongation factor [Solirubrobacterales bacterium]
MNAAAPLTLGTAGHIDHGKTALTRALTGIDTDRLPQEHARGISIELGYARLRLPSGRSLSVIDVPGHERLVRTMVAGATGIDLFLMTIAADDGVMPQTREHAAVLGALGVTRGVVAVTKSDVADPEAALAEADELFPGLAAIPVSVHTGHGLDELRAALDRVAAGTASRAQSREPARLHIDRVFTIRGAGTVVTGTLWAGEIRRGDTLELLPRGRRVRVRGVQVHDEPREAAAAGQRVAVNLTGIGVAEIGRGDVLAGAGSRFAATYLVDAELGFPDREPEPGDRVQVHHGTRESPARLAWLGGRFWQLRLERPLVPARGDRLVIRQIAPPDTLGGGLVLDPHPRKHGPSRDVLARLERLARGEAAEPAAASGSPSAGVRTGDGKPGPRPSGETAPPAAATEPTKLSDRAVELERRLREAGFQPPLDSELDARDLAELRQAGRAVRVSKTLHYHPEALAQVRRVVVELAERRGGSVTLAGLRDELGTSRKFAQALLEHLDAEKVTIRRGDEHVLRRAAQAR